ncbi:DUF7935 family protein [Chitinophaga sancti]|uniref:Uncharacterized protein n=1 Tax=Chitinophaga sancti TaxID=1004 RepID=A0A1K1LTZ2_9BACT|nr:hypothetical protein [Chitinophaga sancti]WQD64851.1 hypothetical protein U0033_10630 [Chitinophaga sancti]WQG89525.1 hypothetical protein SR876_31840 [Chitinophaga sancti]SFW14385.1 hypothetical protein SAMN05661012_00214 [Chitinophaga sancti]
MSNISTQSMLFVVLGIGILTILYMTLRDMFLKPKDKEAAPVATAPVSEKRSSDAAVLPLQLQAYERMALLVDRINLQNLISRVYQPGLGATDMQVGLIHTIKAEFDHNVTQQIYVSAAAWEAVKTLKEQTITIINQVASQLPAEASAMDLNKHILEIFLQAEQSPAEITAQIVNAEARKLF